MTTVTDRFARPLRKLRLSLTDRCNLRCAYCMPVRPPQWLPPEDVIRPDEAAGIVSAFAGCGVTTVRLTGGEPLMRDEIAEIVAAAAAVEGIDDVSLTTNGVLLAERAAELRRAGLMRVNISFDTLRADCFRSLAGSDAHVRVMRGIMAAVRHFDAVKINAVIVRGVNDDEIGALLQFGSEIGAEVRFIEYMDVTTGWRLDRVVTRDEILLAIERQFGPARSLQGGSDPAERFELATGARFGIIGSVTAPFCDRCDRARVTAQGIWIRCLYALAGIDLRAILAAQGVLAARDAIAGEWLHRRDRGAEQRLALRSRGVLPLHLIEPPGGVGMHARGG